MSKVKQHRYSVSSQSDTLTNGYITATTTSHLVQDNIKERLKLEAELLPRTLWRNLDSLGGGRLILLFALVRDLLSLENLIYHIILINYISLFLTNSIYK